MKAKDLIKLLQAVDPESDIITPGFDETLAASDFLLTECFIIWNEQEATTHFAPHDFELEDYGVHDEFKFNGYLLNGKW